MDRWGGSETGILLPSFSLCILECMYTTQYVPAKTSHILHLVLTLFSFGFWSPVWFFVWLYNHNRSVARQVWMPVSVPYPTGQAPVYDTRYRNEHGYLSAVDQALQMALPPTPRPQYDGRYGQ